MDDMPRQFDIRNVIVSQQSAFQQNPQQPDLKPHDPASPSARN